ncbi:hypothetical protein KHA94_06065 [Bacillus sp. FJAT-49705]|uniref:Uncharacterized protein n=1 Tax=Cytobacillus citreus TaxID=2833586 RepID=A0ABS5NQS6_9BACI|nr:hypothetical protein [Cytobacillus citreus]MBS4189773.1 hypothetical protein [Cytobacillus citreus]
MEKNTRGFIIKLMIAILLVGSVGIGAFLYKENSVGASVNGFWAHPKKAKEEGYTLVKSTTIARQQLNDIGTYIDNKDSDARLKSRHRLL